jgi:hypothetical protein
MKRQKSLSNSTAAYMGFYASWAEGTYNEQRCISKLWFGLKFFNWAFEYIFLHLFFNRQRFRADGILIPNLHKALPLCVTLSDTLHKSNLSHNMHKDSQPFAKLKELQSQDTKADTQFAALLILPDRTHALPPPQRHRTNTN